MNIQDDSFDLAQLSERAGVSQRTVRYYIQQGLLPAPEARRPGAHYGPEHLDRLRLIRTLQREHLPLAEIRRQLEGMSPDAIRERVDLDSRRPVSEAKDYIRRVMSEGLGSLAAHSLREPSPESAFQATDPLGKTKPRKQGVRSQWDRIPLAPDVELHVRRPLDREQNRQVERLLDAARHIFEDE